MAWDMRNFKQCELSFCSNEFEVRDIRQGNRLCQVHQRIKEPIDRISNKKQYQQWDAQDQELLYQWLDRNGYPTHGNHFNIKEAEKKAGRR